MKKSFKYWTRDELYKELGLNIAPKMPILVQWLNANPTIRVEERLFLDNLATKSENSIDAWNEAELMQKFINKVIDLVDFDLPQQRCTYFVERYLSATVQKHTLYGYADWMVAEGVIRPSHPYFFMHEYKPEGEKQIDGRGQLLALMLVAQELNKDEQPIYGCFVHGRMWFFVVLQGLSYDISQAYDATRKEALHKIFQILQHQKEIILNKIAVKSQMEITKEYIHSFINQHKSMISERYQVAEMKLFGSFANDTAIESSDIDLVYRLKEGNKLSFRAYTDLLYFIEDSLHRKVDLVNFKNMNPIILKEAEKSMIDLI